MYATISMGWGSSWHKRSAVQWYFPLQSKRVFSVQTMRNCPLFYDRGPPCFPLVFYHCFLHTFFDKLRINFLRKCNLFVIGCIEPLSDRANQRLTCEKNGFNVFTHLAPRREIYTPKKLFLKGLLVQCAISGLFLVYFRSFSTKHQYYFTTN